MATTGSDLTSSFTIKERTGDQRTLTLRERALPYRPFELVGLQRKSIDWYPGSPIGTMQVYGAQEDPTTITGSWKDKFLGGSPGTAAAEVEAIESLGTEQISDGAGGTLTNELLAPSSTVIQTTRDLVALVDDMRRKGQEVEVAWLNQVRRGIISRFSAKWMTGHDCDWEIMFEWISQGEDFQDISVKSDASDLGDLPNKVQAKVDVIVDDSAGIVPQAGDRFATVGQELRGLGAKLQEMTDELTDMVIQAATTVSQPDEALRRAVGILDGLKLEAELLWSIATDTADGIALDLTEAISFGASLFQRGGVRDRAGSATDLRNLAAREEVRLLQRANSDLIRIFQAREGQDLREVSQTFYNTTEQWRSLMVFNRKTTSRLSAGEVVFVPARPVGDNC